MATGYKPFRYCALIVFLSTIIELNGQDTNHSDIDYYFSPDLSCNISFNSTATVNYDLLFEMHIIDIQNSGLHQILLTDITLKQSILYWLHLRLFQLIDSSFLYADNIDQHTVNLWNEYCLYLLSINNYSTHHKTVTLLVNIAISKIDIQQIILLELQKNGEEIAAYLRYKLSDFINNYYAKMTVDDLYIDLTLSDSNNNHTLYQNNTSHNKTMYVLIISICLIIMAIITMSICVYKRLQKSIKDMKSLVFVGYKLKTQSESKTYSKQAPKLSISQISHITNEEETATAITELQINETIANATSPNIPVMDNNIFHEPLPFTMQKAPSAESIATNIQIIPPKSATKMLGDRSKSSPNIFDSITNGNIKKIQHYNENITNITPKKRVKRRHNTVDSNNSMQIIHEQKESIVSSYDDNDKIAAFNIINDDELCDTLFNHSVID